MNNLFVRSGARFSSCGKYRYGLFRERDEGNGEVNFIMLNPSTADAETNDPTVERCQRRAWVMGYKRVTVTNLFALRSTDPQKLYKDEDPVGSENDYWLVMAAAEATIVICAWGLHGNYRGRGEEVRDMLRANGAKLYYLRLSKAGIPTHPLYLPYSEGPQLWIS